MGEKYMGESLPEAALVLAGGLGTRLRPITNKIPKPMVDINGKPTIAHIIDEIVRNGISAIYVSVGYKAGIIEDYLKRYDTPASIKFIREKERLGTGGAIKLAMSKIPCRDIFMTYGDDLFNISIKEMYKLHKRKHSNITISIRKAGSDAELSASGVVGLRGSKVIEFVEKPKPEFAPSKFINIGKYIISEDIASLLPKQRKFSFEKDFLEGALGAINVNAYKMDTRWYPTDTPERLERAIREWR